MKIDQCPYSQYCGERKSDSVNNSVWFCGHRTFCPYGSCELPAPIAKPIPKTEPVKTDKQLEADATMAKNELMNKRFTILKQMEEEGLSRSQAAQRLGISYYTVESIEEMYGYKFNFATVKKISWPEYDAQIIALKQDNPKMTTEKIAKIVGLNHKVVANRWSKIKGKSVAK